MGFRRRAILPMTDSDGWLDRPMDTEQDENDC